MDNDLISGSKDSFEMKHTVCVIDGKYCTTTNIGDVNSYWFDLNVLHWCEAPTYMCIISVHYNMNVHGLAIFRLRLKYIELIVLEGTPLVLLAFNIPNDKYIYFSCSNLHTIKLLLLLYMLREKNCVRTQNCFVLGCVLQWKVLYLSC